MLQSIFEAIVPDFIELVVHKEDVVTPRTHLLTQTGDVIVWSPGLEEVQDGHGVEYRDEDQNGDRVHNVVLNELTGLELDVPLDHGGGLVNANEEL